MSAAILKGCSGNGPIAIRNLLARPPCLVDALANAICSVSRQNLIEIRRPCGEAWRKIFRQEFSEGGEDVCAAHLAFRE
jgi:hypothetical protein